MDLCLKLDFSFEDLYRPEGYQRLDACFFNFLEEDLRNQLIRARENAETLDSTNESNLILDLAPYLENFLGFLFSIEAELKKQKQTQQDLTLIHQCKRQFVQRQAVKNYSVEETENWDPVEISEKMENILGQPVEQHAFAHAVLKWMKDEERNHSFLESAARYAAWQCYHHPNPAILFRLPEKSPPLEKISSFSRIHGPLQVLEAGEKRSPAPLSRAWASDQSHYCLICHHRQKDYCTKGLPATGSKEIIEPGCPLKQKISEMNALRNKGFVLGALATIIIDNPLVAATGKRICNDCMKACIFQKQDAVDVPSVETQTLLDVLDLPWGFEVYSLLTRWNPLNFRRPFPLPLSGYTILVAGMGPAGFNLAHHLLNEGHNVVGIDGLKIEPLSFPFHPVLRIQDFFSSKVPGYTYTSGFGGVCAYGITDRWDKNFLLVIRLLLERRKNFLLMGSIRLGSSITVDQVFERGFDHLALCMGAKQPDLPHLSGILSKGVRTAADFLMALHLNNPAKEGSVSSLQIQLPVVVIGGGLTAIDAATQALSYYPQMVEKFAQHFKLLNPLSLTLLEKKQAEEFLMHAQLLQEEKRKAQAENRPPNILKMLHQWGGVTVLSRRSLYESAAYRTNMEELSYGLDSGIFFAQHANPLEIIPDADGHVTAVKIECINGEKVDFPCRTVLLATGTKPNTQLAKEDPSFPEDHHFFRSTTRPMQVYRENGNPSVTFFGDLHPTFAGSVVKAMASAKAGVPTINALLLEKKPAHKDPEQLKKDFFSDFQSIVKRVQRLNSKNFEITIKSPAAARQFLPGHIFRLQNFHSYASSPSEGVALTGIKSDVKEGTLSFILSEAGASSTLLAAQLTPHMPVSLMGPTGMPFAVPENKNVLFVGWGTGNTVFFSLAQAFFQKNNTITFIAGYDSPDHVIKPSAVEQACNTLIWCCERGRIPPRRLQDFFYSGTPNQAMIHFQKKLNQVDYMISMAPCHILKNIAAVKDHLLPVKHFAIGNDYSTMQCMMKGVCGQCVRTMKNKESGEQSFIYACSNPNRPLNEIDFSCLLRRLTQNSLLEKMNAARVKKQ